MAVWKRAVIRGTIVLATLCFLLYLSLFLVVRSAGFQNWLRSTIATRSGYDFDATDFSFAPPLRLIIDNCKLIHLGKPVLQSERVTLSFTPVGLFSRRIYGVTFSNSTFYFDPAAWVDMPAQRSTDLTVRHLNVRGGTIVIQWEGGEPVIFRSIVMDAENINLGGLSGLTLGTDLPWANARAEIYVVGEGSEKTVTIGIRQSAGKSGSLTSVKQPELNAATATVKLRRSDSREIEAVASGRLDDFTLAGQNWKGNFELTARMSNSKQIGFSGNFAAPQLPAKIGSLPFILNKGPITATLAGRYSPPNKSMEFESLRLVSATGTASGSGSVNFDGSSPSSAFHLALRDLPPEALRPVLPQWLAESQYRGSTEADLDLKGSGTALSIQGIARTRGSNWNGNGLSMSGFSMDAPFQWKTASLRSEGLRIAGQGVALSGQTRTKISADEIIVNGDVERTGTVPLKMRGKLEIRRGGFSTLDRSRAGEAFQVKARVDTATINENSITVTGEVNIEQGQVLWRKFFADLKEQRPALSFDAEYAASTESLRARRLNLTMANIGTIDAAANVERLNQSPVFAVTLQSPGLKTGGIFDSFVRDALKTTYPFLDQLLVTGQLGLSASARGGLADLSASGVLQVQRGVFGAKSGDWQIGPIDLTLPFLIHFPAARMNTGTKVRQGTLVMEAARFGSEAASGFKASLSLRDNVLQFEQPMHLGIYGGTVDVRNLVWSDIIAQPAVATFSVDLKDLQLERLTRALNWYPFTGTLSGSIPRVNWNDKSIRTEGQIQGEIFRGETQITKLEIENPFLPTFSIKSNLRFQNIDLEELTRTFQFGTISGILEGSATDLIITDGQPAQFFADFHNVERSGVSQWISVEALNKITVLSSGTNANVLYGGLTRLFDSFRYSKLGFKAALKNDKLTLHGIETRDNLDYLVVGTIIPPTVNVISHTQEISFGELVRRLTQIRTSQPRATQ